MSVLGNDTKLCDPTYGMAFVGPSSRKNAAGKLVTDSGLDVCCACGWWDTLLLKSLWAHMNTAAVFSERAHLLFGNKAPDTVVLREDFGGIMKDIIWDVLTLVSVKGSHSCCESDNSSRDGSMTELGEKNGEWSSPCSGYRDRLSCRRIEDLIYQLKLPLLTCNGVQQGDGPMRDRVVGET